MNECVNGKQMKEKEKILDNREHVLFLYVLHGI